MFDKYGEFDSADEMNRAAAAQLAEGDTAAVLAIAEENGLDQADAEDYIDGMEPVLASPLMAADGKLTVEAADIGIQEGILSLWLGQIRQLCTEDPALCLAVRKKGKRLAECLAAMIRYSFEHKVRVSDKVVDLVKVQHNGKTVPMQKPLYLGFPDNAKAKELIRDYYLGGGGE